MLSDDPTPGELDRRLERLDQNIERGFAQINSRLDRVVGTDVFSMYQQSNDQRVSATERRIQRVEDERTADKRQLTKVWATAGLALLVGLVLVLLRITFGV